MHLLIINGLFAVMLILVLGIPAIVLIGNYIANRRPNKSDEVSHMYDAYDQYRANEDLHPSHYPEPEIDAWTHAHLIGSHDCANDVHMQMPGGATFMGCTECMAAHEALTGSQPVVRPDFEDPRPAAKAAFGLVKSLYLPDQAA